MKAFTLTGLITLLLAVSLAADEVAITVYNQNLALVKEGRTLDFKQGINTLNLTDVASSIDPTSVHFRLKSGGSEIELLEQNYQYDLVSSEKILQKYLGHSIDVIMKNGDVLSGKYLSSSSGYLVLQFDDGSVKLINQGEMLSVAAPKLPEGLIVVPTLQWLVASDITGKRDVQVSYLTSNINWHAEYVAQLDEKDKNIRLSGWVSLDNRSGKTYKDAKLKLVAGDIHLVRPSLRRGPSYELATMDALGMKKAPGFEEKAFFEYHLYTLGRRTTVANNETKQVSLFEPASTPVEKIYRYHAGGNDVNVVVKFKNSKENGLGMPLPAGKIRMTKLDSDGSEEFLGEDAIDHTPKDEELELKVGNAFDIVCETETVDSKRISDRVREVTTEISLRNHKEEDVEVVVVSRLGRDWRILDSSHEWKKKNASTVEFVIPVPKDGEVKLSYRVRYGM
ncbi:MAG: DUF4139 domain-containing protein [candidate division Zixibacteria bacterium]|nr:DUF4139 domain-containing protein [candidate division Zixibacteria bacterium]